MEEDRMLILTPDAAEIVKRCRSALYLALEGKFHCTAQIYNVEDGAALTFLHNKGAIVPEIKYKKRLSKNLNISVWKDDLTTHQVDAVVNAANEQLSHGAGLARALSQAGGPTIQKMSHDLIRQYGKVNTGDAVCTPSGNLPCKMIIHAVGPCVPISPTPTDIAKASQLLQKTIWNILETAQAAKLQSVAIPTISSGIFNFPLAKCAKIIVDTVKTFSERAMSLEVRLVNNDDPSVQEMLKACVSILGPGDQLPAGNLGNPPTQFSLPSLNFGKVTLQLKQGAIEDEETDVIVNTIGIDLDLSKGQVSRALLEKAGMQIQQKVKQQTPRYAVEGDVIETSGCILQCKEVYHTVCASKLNRGDYAEQILHSVVTDCLLKATSKGYSSMSFPALGTGNLGFRNADVSRIMTDAVEEFSKKYTGSMINIFFVIFPRDTETLKAFNDRMNSTNMRLQSLQISSSTNFKSPDLEFKGPFIKLSSPSKEACREAKSWIHRIMCLCPEKLEIYNNNIVHLSLEDHEKLISLQSAFQVSITEFFKGGRGGFFISGGAVGVGCAALEVEAILCQAQENFARDEEKYLEGDLYRQQTDMSYTYQKTLPAKWEIEERMRMFSKYGLSIAKVEKIENPVLKQLFMLNDKRIQAQPQRLYQCVNAQFTELICRVGFQREYAPPREQKYGAGIYFTSNLEKAQYFWPGNEDEYVYFIEAQVLTGKDTSGSPELIVPPPIGSNPLVRYDSVTNKRGIHVIFNGQQANPEFLITCSKKQNSF